MDVLIYHVELLEQNFPDCCARCGADDTELEWVGRQSVTFTAGEIYQYGEVFLPFCPRHIKPPVVSFAYPAIHHLTREGIVIKNVSPEFVEAMEEFRETYPPNRRPRADIPTVSPEAIRQGEQAYRRFAIGMILAAILVGVVIIGIALAIRFWPNESPQKEAPKRDTTHDLKGPDEFGPPGFPRGSKLNSP